MVTSLQHITTTGTAICVWLIVGGGCTLSRISTVVTLHAAEGRQQTHQPQVQQAQCLSFCMLCFQQLLHELSE